MLPPIPHSLIPVTAQQDVVKPRPEIAPVTPTAETAQEDSVGLDKRHPDEVAEGEVDEADEPAIDQLPRQGLWVDVEV